MVRVLAIALLVVGCSQPQVRKVHRAGEIATAGGLLGVLACGVAASIDTAHQDPILKAGLVFVPISVVGALLYIATDKQVNRDDGPPEPTRRERNRDTAWALTKQAAQAARAEDCTQVQAIAPRVRELDKEFHGSVFMADAAIARCLR